MTRVLARYWARTASRVLAHYEADLDRSGRSVLDIRPLLWKDGWPVAGDNFKEGTYEIQSERSGYALEASVDFVRMARDSCGFMTRPSNLQIPELRRTQRTWADNALDFSVSSVSSVVDPIRSNPCHCLE